MHPSFVSFALGIIVIFGMAVFGVDVTYLFDKRVAARSAADLAALAGAWDLPGDPTTARAKAYEFAEENGFNDNQNGIQVEVYSPPVNGPSAGVSGLIEVIITYPAPTFFASVLGVNNVDVRGRAVAGIQDTGGRYAIYAGYDDCSQSNGLDTLTLSGSDGVIDGLIHSNGGLKASGQGNLLGPTTYHCSGLEQGNNTYASGPTRGDTKPYPLTLDPADFAPSNCTFTVNGTFDLGSNGSWWQDYSQKILMPGVYCSDGLLKGMPQGTTGDVTFVAKNIEISAGDVTLTPYLNDVLLFSTDTTNSDVAIKVNGSNNELTGIIYACPKPPYTDANIFTCKSQIDMSGSDGLSADISVIGGRIKISGSTINLRAFAGIGGGQPRPSLME